MAADEKVKLPPVELTNVEIDDDGVLYIRIADFQGGPMRAKEYCSKILGDFQKVLPDTKIIVGINDLRFSAITKKQEFVGRLDGQIQKTSPKQC